MNVTLIRFTPEPDALWQVVDDLIAGKSACAHCEFAEGCLLRCDARMGCEDWCLQFEEVDADDEKVV